VLNKASRLEVMCGIGEKARCILILFLDVKFLHYSERRMVFPKCGSGPTAGGTKMVVLCVSVTSQIMTKSQKRIKYFSNSKVFL